MRWGSEHLCRRGDVRLPGEHNLANVAAAAALAELYRPPVKSDAITGGVAGFAGVPDRIELVRELGGVRFVNDTTATTETATVAALRALDAPVVLIAGGVDKGLPFDQLAGLLGHAARTGEPRVRGIVLLEGTGTERLRAALEDAGARPEGVFDSLADAVRHARALARPGDVVLLSPACASFGMFVNEFDRGEQFRRIVRELR